MKGDKAILGKRYIVTGCGRWEDFGTNQAAVVHQIPVGSEVVCVSVSPLGEAGDYQSENFPYPQIISDEHVEEIDESPKTLPAEEHGNIVGFKAVVKDASACCWEEGTEAIVVGHDGQHFILQRQSEEGEIPKYQYFPRCRFEVVK